MLPESQLKRLMQSKEASFYDLIFVNIDESLFSVLYNEEKCPTVKQKKGRVYYFTDEDYKKNSRNRKIKELPAEGRKIRNNVVATMKEFTKGFNHKGKLNIKGYFKTVIFAIATAIGINFGRIYRYQINYQT